MDSLITNILLHDNLRGFHIPRYEPAHLQPSYVFSPEQMQPVDAKLYESADESIVIPLTSKSINWDKALIQMLDKCIDECVNDDIPNLMTVDSLKSPKSVTDIIIETKMYFDTVEVHQHHAITHPSRTSDLIPYQDELFKEIYESDECSANVVYITCPPHFLGSYITQGHLAGAWICNAKLVFKLVIND